MGFVVFRFVSTMFAVDNVLFIPHFVAIKALWIFWFFMFFRRKYESSAYESDGGYMASRRRTNEGGFTGDNDEDSISVTCNNRNSGNPVSAVQGIVGLYVKLDPFGRMRWDTSNGSRSSGRRRGSNSLFTTFPRKDR